MNKWIVSIAASVALVRLAQAETAPFTSHPDSSSWDSLFAADLSNADFPKGVWYIEDGAMTANKDEAIWTQKDLENFAIDLEFKTTEDANSGIVIYATDTKNWIPNSVEVQILDDGGPKWKDAAPTWKCGAVFGRLAATKSMVKKPGEWNRMTVSCQGPMVHVVLNGELVTQCDMRKWTSAKKNPDGSDIPPWLSRPMAEMATKGRVGLQGKHGNSLIYFRNVKIKPLG